MLSKFDSFEHYLNENYYTLYCLNSTQASKALLSLALINDMK